jgi:RNA polymerase sigma-70 factor (ECF subfamily)
MDPHQERSVGLLLSHRAMLLGYIASIVRDADLAEDVFQNVAVVVLKKAGAVKNDAEFPAWARRVARLEALAALRQRKRSPELLDESVLELLEGHWAATDASPTPARKALRECVERLSPYARQLIRLRYVEDLSAKKVAEQLNRSPNTVYVALSRTYRLLAGCVQHKLARQGEAYD